MRSIKINVLSVAVAVLSSAALTALYITSVTINIIISNIIIIFLLKDGLKNIKQIYHALFQATSEIMDS